MDRLETRMDGINTRLRGVETGLATLTERVAHLPSRGFTVNALLAWLTAVAGLVVFAENIRTAIGL